MKSQRNNFLAEGDRSLASRRGTPEDKGAWNCNKAAYFTQDVLRGRPGLTKWKAHNLPHCRASIRCQRHRILISYTGAMRNTIARVLTTGVVQHWRKFEDSCWSHRRLRLALYTKGTSAMDRACRSQWDGERLQAIGMCIIWEHRSGRRRRSGELVQATGWEVMTKTFEQ